MSQQDNYEAPPNGFRTFLIVWATQSLSVFGSALTFFAITIWLATSLYAADDQKPQLALALAAVSLAFALPTVFLAPIAGAWADRHDRKRTMIIADFLNGTLSLVVMTLMLNGLLSMPVLLVLMVGFATVGGFHGAAFDTSYAMLVPEKQLPRANGMMQTIWALSGILSPALAAFIISLPDLARQGSLGITSSFLAGMSNGAPLVIAIDSVTFFIGGAVLLFLFIPSPKRSDVNAQGKAQKSIWADVKEGALFIWDRRPMLWLLATFTVANFAGAPMEVFQPLILKFNLVSDWESRGMTLSTALALLGTAAGLGGLAGGLFISAWGGLKKRRVYGVLVPMIAAGASMIGFGLSGSLYFTAAMAFISAGMIPLMNAHSQTIWQTQTPRELQGRVFSVRRVIAQFTWPASTAIAGVAGGIFNPGWVMATLGGILMIFCVAQFFNPVLLRVEDKEYLDNMADRAAGGRVEEASASLAPGVLPDDIPGLSAESYDGIAPPRPTTLDGVEDERERLTSTR